MFVGVVVVGESVVRDEGGVRDVGGHGRCRGRGRMFGTFQKNQVSAGWCEKWWNRLIVVVELVVSEGVVVVVVVAVELEVVYGFDGSKRAVVSERFGGSWFDGGAMGVPYRDKEVLADCGEAKAVGGGKEEGSDRGMEFSTELGKSIRFVVAANVLEGSGTVGKVLAPFVDVLWLVKVGRNPLTYDEAFRQTRSDLADVVP